MLAAVAVAVATAWVYGLLERYQPDGRDWLAGPAFASGWEVEGPAEGIAVHGGTARLTNADPEGGVGLRLRLRRGPGDAAVFELSAVVWTEGLGGGRPRWRGGRVTFTDRGSDRGSAGFPRGRNVELANLQADRAPAPYRKRFVVGSDAAELELAVRLRHATGTIGVGDLRMVGYVERPAFRRAADGLRLAWAGLFLVGLGLALRAVEGAGPRAAMAGLAVAAAVVLMMPHSAREGIAGLLSRDLLGGAVSVETAARIGHFWLFAAIGCAARVLRPGDRPLVLLAALVPLAGASELAQLMADARSPSLPDWGADCLGAALGLRLGSRAPRGKRLTGGAAG